MYGLPSLHWNTQSICSRCRSAAIGSGDRSVIRQRLSATSARMPLNDSCCA